MPVSLVVCALSRFFGSLMMRFNYPEFLTSIRRVQSVALGAKTGNCRQTQIYDKIVARFFNHPSLARVAQWLERGTFNPKVGGSRPPSGVNFTFCLCGRFCGRPWAYLYYFFFFNVLTRMRCGALSFPCFSCYLIHDTADDCRICTCYVAQRPITEYLTY